MRDSRLTSLSDHLSIYLIADGYHLSHKNSLPQKQKNQG